MQWYVLQFERFAVVQTILLNFLYSHLIHVPFCRCCSFRDTQLRHDHFEVIIQLRSTIIPGVGSLLERVCQLN